MEKPRWREREMVFGECRTAGPGNLARKSHARKCPSVDTAPLAREQWPAMPVDSLKIRPAREADVSLLLEFIRAIAEYEKLLDQVTATEEGVRESLFGERPAAEAVIGDWAGQPAAYAVFFQNFSTFTGRAGLYLEDLFVKPEYRQRGIGKGMLKHLAKIAVDRGCPRFEWVALDWNEPAIEFYQGIGARQMGDWRLFRMSNEPLKQLAAEE
jgi:GNAT superfamily N-acetyltransferase